mmetsp:Transcript_15990/g.19896  ORF Transcript_15990/g.19896 Transcript_15990/m.19896 type:complete len:202 (+) Transcript_15990:1331-1936(+)
MIEVILFISASFSCSLSLSKVSGGKIEESRRVLEDKGVVLSKRELSRRAISTDDTSDDASGPRGVSTSIGTTSAGASSSDTGITSSWTKSSSSSFSIDSRPITPSGANTCRSSLSSASSSSITLMSSGSKTPHSSSSSTLPIPILPLPCFVSSVTSSTSIQSTSPPISSSKLKGILNSCPPPPPSNNNTGISTISSSYSPK